MPLLFIQVEVTADPSLFDELVGVMSTRGFNGFWEEARSLRCFIRNDRWTSGDQRDLQSTAERISRAHGLPVPRITISALEDQNWNAAWEATLQPIRITPRIIITPSWRPVTAQAGEIVLRIDPKMSFGTGYHETTRLMLKLLDHHLTPGARVLDLGTGTGVLAIAAIKLGAGTAVAIDNDEWACSNAKENVEANLVGQHISIVRGELSGLPMEQFDLVMANLQRDVIERLLPTMTERLAADGRLIIAGLLLEDEEPVRSALSSCGLAILQELRENEWIALVASRPDNPPRPSMPG